MKRIIVYKTRAYVECVLKPKAKAGKFGPSEDLERTQKMPVVVPMKEMIWADYLKKIRNTNLKLKAFGWMVIAHSSTLDYESKKVVLMHSNGSDRKVFDDLSEAIQYLAPVLNNKKFDETVLNAHTAGNRTKLIVYSGSVYSG